MTALVQLPKSSKLALRFSVNQAERSELPLPALCHCGPFRYRIDRAFSWIEKEFTGQPWRQSTPEAGFRPLDYVDSKLGNLPS